MKYYACYTKFLHIYDYKISCSPVFAKYLQANIPMKPTTACERYVRIKWLNTFHSNLYVIKKLTKPVTMLIKTIVGSQTTILLRNRVPN